MDTWDAYRSRRNVRRHAAEPLAPGALERIIDAGRRAPSAFNSQPWDFVSVTDPAVLPRLATVWKGAQHVATSAATIVVTTPIQPDPDRARWSEFDLGQAVMAMTIIAADLGIGSAHALIEDEQRCRDLLGIPTDQRCAYLLSLGRPADRPLSPIERPDRRAIDEVHHRERW
jgi:nitroreductase